MARTPIKETETQLNVILSKKLHRQFKAKVALAGSSMLRTLVELIDQYVEAVDLPEEKTTKF